ncbi:glycosyltransferase family 2 protein [Larkinella rosea]|uniref:Glycosyltransferase family 2 protein n=1 Tax=Larkinella rosea TaxID=2025312 RepID=A0A3P1C0M5_9BACT|nr:glycosyltransferase family 2 protein [Larkinella rosea]RRB06344.1 glycosyltransferase family 2 protein [Larkinella rosea]
MATPSDPTRPTISVALCTYNGEAYLETQLQSILKQSLLPDELVVCDDDSTDQTRAVLEAFASRAPFPVRIFRNPTRLGFNKNFEKAFSHCTGEFIFICDQDDCWLPEKIETLSTYLVQHPATDLVFSNAHIADTQLNDTGRLFWDTVRFTEPIRERWRRGEAMEVLLDGNRVMGCTSALRRRLLADFLPIPNLPNYIYDGWMGLVAAAKGTIDFYEKPLIWYRTHEKQQVGTRPPAAGKPVRFMDRFSRPHREKLDPLIRKHQNLSDLYKLVSQRVPDQTPGIRQFKRRLAHYARRSTLPDGRFSRLGGVVRELFSGNYHRYVDQEANAAAPYLAAVGDLLE